MSDQLPAPRLLSCTDGMFERDKGVDFEGCGAVINFFYYIFEKLKSLSEGFLIVKSIQLRY